jgi:hypothetical protein
MRHGDLSVLDLRYCQSNDTDLLTVSTMDRSARQTRHTRTFPSHYLKTSRLNLYQVYVFEVAHLNSKAISSYQSSLSSNVTPSLNKDSNVPPKMLRLFALYENLTRFVLPLCSAIQDRPHPETPISQSNNIVDISHVGLKQFWNLKSHMQGNDCIPTSPDVGLITESYKTPLPWLQPTIRRHWIGSS